jgi:hypothetical protein
MANILDEVLSFNVIAAVDEYKFVKATHTTAGDRKCAHATAGEMPLGISLDSQETVGGQLPVASVPGRIAILTVDGSGTSIAVGDRLKPGTAGVGVKADSGDFYGAVALAPATTSGAKIPVLLMFGEMGAPTFDGNLDLTGTLDVAGDVAVATNKFTVAAASGNTAVAGTLGVAGDVAVATNKFTVAAASGNTAVAGTLGVAGDVAVATNKFTVAAASGNTAVAGTLGATGLSTLSGGVKVGASGQQILDVRRFTGTVNSGGATVQITATGVTSAWAVMGANIRENCTNDVAIASVVPGADVIDVILTGDPGASNADLEVLVAKLS